MSLLNVLWSVSDVSRDMTCLLNIIRIHSEQGVFFWRGRMYCVMNGWCDVGTRRSSDAALTFIFISPATDSSA